jgi:tetratricopeptide (TPR) repeat protein
MAKKCNVCKKSYPDTEPRCPHCAKAADEVVDLARPSDESDSSVQLGDAEDVELASGSGLIPTSEPPSATSNVAWTALVEDVDEANEPAARIDAPSDRDLLAHADSPVPSKSAGGDEPFVAEVASEENPTGEVPSDVRLAQDESSAVDLANLASKRPADSDAVEAAEDSSSVRLGDKPRKPAQDSPSAPDLARLAKEPDSAVEAEAAEEDDTHFLDDAAEVEAGSSVNLGEATRPTDRPSSRDLIAEAVESGVDLAGKASAPAEEATEVVDSAIDLGAGTAEEPQSSGPDALPERKVPPGSHHDIDLEPDEAAGARTPSPKPSVSGPGSSGVDLGGAAGRPPRRPAPSSSDVDLVGSAVGTRGEESDVAMAEEEDEEAVPARGRPAKARAEEGEEAQAAAVADEDAAATRKTSRAPKARSGVGCLVLGCVLGLLVGAGTPIGLALSGVFDPAKELGAALGMSKTSTTGSGGAGQGSKPVQAAPPPAQDPGLHLKHGEFAKVVEGLKDVAAPTPAVQGQRGTARWMQYLQDQMGKGAPMKADDEGVKEARADLEAAAKESPEALLSLGNLQEHTADAAAATKTYQEGLNKYKDTPGWGRAFQAQLDRLESTVPRPDAGGKPPPAGGKPPPRVENRGAAFHREAAARALVELLIAFQAGQPAPPAGGDAAEDEAGFPFWAAVKAAHNGDYGAATDALEAARKAHDKLRFSRLRKAQNPLSDPTEEIFLRCVREIDAYWRLGYYLKEQGVLAKNADAMAAVKDVFAAMHKAQQGLKEIAEKVQATPDTAPATVEKLVKAKDAADTKVKALETDLAAAKKKAEDATKEYVDAKMALEKASEQLKAADDRMKGVAARLDAAGIKNPDLAKGVDALAAARAAAEKTLGTVTEKLATANVKVEKKDVLQGVERVVELALAKDPKGELTSTREEVKRLNGVLAQRRTPRDMLDIWLPIVANRTQKADAPKAIADAGRVADDPTAGPEARGKALAVTGLARRNLGEYEAAGNLLHNSLRIGGEKGDWQAIVTAALRELTDPNAYYLTRIRDLYKDGKTADAYAALAEARKVFSKEVAVFQALDSLIQLEMAREKGKGKIDPASPAFVAAKASAEKAAAAGSAEGHYALGRVNEEQGNLAEAKAAYTKALAAHPDNDADGARYRLALARVLKLQAGQTPVGARTSAARDISLADLRREPLLTLVMLVEIGMQAGGGAGQDEATKLLEEVQNAKDGPDTFMLKAQALALRGLWTPALKTYATGLRAHVRRDYADGLADLIDHHPGLRRPSALDPPNPLLGEATYASGLRHYFARNYRAAEDDFARAVEYDNQDARYYYFLGLSRLTLGKNVDADADFRDGAQLERLNRPGREAVSSSLERVQGPPRQTVNGYRP